MRSNIDDATLDQTRQRGTRYSTLETTINGDYTILPTSPIKLVLDGGASARTIRLPEIFPDGGQEYWITNDGVGDFNVVDDLGSAVAVVNADVTGIFSSLPDGTWRVLFSGTGASGAGLISIEFVIDGGGTTITTGVKGDLEIPFDCVIQRATLLADAAGNIAVDVWKDSYGNYPPTVLDKITNLTPPTLIGIVKSQDSALVGWTTAISAGDTLRFNVSAIPVPTVQRVTLALKCLKT